MYKPAKNDRQQEKTSRLNEKPLETDLEKAIDTVKKQSSRYQQAGMTHISSLLS